MINSSTIQVILNYKLIDCKEWQIIRFLSENYFDLESNEIISLDSIPFYNHATDYLQTSLIAVSPHHELIEGLRQSQML